MNIETQNKLEQAKRRHRQKQDLSHFRAGLHEATGIVYELSLHDDLEKTLSLQAHVYNRLRELRTSGKLNVKDGLDVKQFEAMAKEALARDSKTSFLVFLCHWEHMGALVLKGIELSKHFLKLLEFDGDTVTACTDDLKRIVSFDRRIESNGKVLYEVNEWRQEE